MDVSSQLRTPPEGPSGLLAPSGAGVGRVESSTSRNESPEAKRRKIRKGTRSCWECKRRKIRCNFASAADVVCIGCRRRGTHCVSQEYPEEASRPADRGQQIGDRIVRVEALVEQLVKQATTGRTSSDPQIPPNFNFVANTTATSPATLPMDTDDMALNPTLGLPTPACSEGSGESAQVMSYYDACPGVDLGSECPHTALPTPRVRPEDSITKLGRAGPALPERLQKLSDELYAVVPSAEDVRCICLSSGGTAVHFHQMVSATYAEIEAQGLLTPERMMVLPSRNAHPVLIARYVIILATFLQCIPAGTTKLSEPPRVMMRRLVDTAARLVTTNEELMGTVEILECIMLEGLFQANSGNLRRAWLAFRRAMVVGQLMGIHRSYQTPLKKLDPNTHVNPQFIWWRIMHADKYLCLMLGLPQGTVDTSFADEAVLAKETGMGRLERLHTQVATHVLERNEKFAINNKSDFRDTLNIDLELQKAAKVMPAKWWLPPNLAKLSQTSSQEEIFWETIRMVNQLFHYNILNQLHLPYMLRFTPDKRYEYSKMACVNASRELLSRFITFRSWNSIAFCCRSIDFFALMAAMTLLLAHLDSHRQEGSFNSLAHQRLGDRAMMEQVLENMDMVNKVNLDVLSEKSGDLLRRLLEIEADAADGKTYHTQSVCDLATGELNNDAATHADVTTGQCMGPTKGASPGGIEDGPVASEDHAGVLWMCIPYFGVIKIARDGGISKEPSAVRPSDPTPTSVHTVFGLDKQSTERLSVATPDNDAEAGEIGGGGSLGGIGGPLMTPPQGQQQQEQPQHEFAPEFPNPIEQAIQTEYAYPGLAADADDWAFQGVDMAFFDSLMRGVDNGDGKVQTSDWGVGGWVV